MDLKNDYVIGQMLKPKLKNWIRICQDEIRRLETQNKEQADRLLHFSDREIERERRHSQDIRQAIKEARAQPPFQMRIRGAAEVIVDNLNEPTRMDPRHNPMGWEDLHAR